MEGLLWRFIVRWVVCSLGLWIAASLLGPDHLSVGNKLSAILGAGFILAVINALLKPILVILSLPAILLSLGLFMLVVNGLVILIASKLYEPFYVKNLAWAMLAGIIIGLVNYLVTAAVEDLK